MTGRFLAECNDCDFTTTVRAEYRQHLVETDRTITNRYGIKQAHRVTTRQPAEDLCQELGIPLKEFLAVAAAANELGGTNG